MAALLEGSLIGLFRGVHVLPPFPSSGDRGFAPLTYYNIDPRFGGWEDVRRIGERYDVMLDLMINHISRQSPEFQDFERQGRRSPYADLFITLDKVWPDGDPPRADVERIFLRKPDSPFSTITIRETGERERVWTSFGSADWSEQVDLDVTSPGDPEAHHRVAPVPRLAGRSVRPARRGRLCDQEARHELLHGGARDLRLPWLGGLRGSIVRTDGASRGPRRRTATHRRLGEHGLWTYDFVLPGLVLNAFETGDATRLADHLERSPDRVFTTLDCHDGIPVRPDLDGILEPAEMLGLADLVERRGGNVNRILSPAHDAGVDVHQLNCTYYSALGCDDDRYLAARAIQLFARGVPQIYYVGLLAGENDDAAMARSGDGRAINRHDYTAEEVERALDRPVVAQLHELIRLRNTHPAFDGSLSVETVGFSRLLLMWRNGQSSCSLDVDVASGQLTVDDSPVRDPVPETGVIGRSRACRRTPRFRLCGQPGWCLLPDRAARTLPA